MYILASQRNGTLYIGVTANLIKRIWEHRNEVVEGFTKKFGIHLLVYDEQHGTMESAIAREKQLKKWNRAWKLRLIEEANPEWFDVWPRICGRPQHRHSRAGGNPSSVSRDACWMPACAGMTGFQARVTSRCGSQRR